MAQRLRTAQKPQQKLTTRLFLSPAMHQSIEILQFTGVQLDAYLQRMAAENPFLRVLVPRADTVADVSAAAPTLPTLTDFLTAQVRLLSIPTVEKKAVRGLIAELDANGYLPTDLPAVNAIALGILQSLEPAGVGARNLTECLLLQAQRQKHFFPLAVTLLSAGELTRLADASTWAALARDYGGDAMGLSQALAAIRTLDPAPGKQYAPPQPIQYIVPDLVLVHAGDTLQLTPNSKQQSRLRFVRKEYDRLTHQASDATAQQYLRTQRQQFVTLRNALDRREGTLAALGSLVAEKQRVFLQGNGQLAPLTQRAAARSLQLHPTTIGRAIHGKYVQTDQRIYPLSEFFPRAVGTNQITAEAVIRRIQDLVAAEDPSDPLSDALLNDQLARVGIVMSRRAVTKYRRMVGIPTSYVRWREWRTREGQ